VSYFSDIAKGAKAFGAMSDVLKTTDSIDILCGLSKLKDIPSPGTLDDLVARQWYKKAVDTIPQLIDASKPLETQARQASELRNQIRTITRNAMTNQALAKQLFKNNVNLTWEQVVAKYSVQGFKGDALWREIIAAATRSNPEVNASLGLH
jgi:filamentous hemagglutinin